MSSPEATYAMYYSDIERKIKDDGYVPETSMENLIIMSILHFDDPDNYGGYNPETGSGGYGDEFTLSEFFRYIHEHSWEEFDYYC